MKRGSVTCVIVGLLLLAAAFLPVLPASSAAANLQEQGIIGVYGEAVITAQPDSARVVLAVETTHELAQKAAAENARLTNAVLAALTASGLDKKQLKTSGYRLNSYNQQIDPQNKEKYVTEYRAYNELDISLDNLGAVGDIIDIAIKAGANRVLSVFFELKDSEALKLLALQKATAQAQAKAAAIAQSAGIKIKGIKVIQEEMTGYTPYRFSEFDSIDKGMAVGGATPIIQDDVEVVARVRAEYYF